MKMKLFLFLITAFVVMSAGGAMFKPSTVHRPPSTVEVDTIPVQSRGVTPPRNIRNYDQGADRAYTASFGKMLAVKAYSATAGDTLLGYVNLYFYNDSTLVLGSDTVITTGNIGDFALLAEVDGSTTNELTAYTAAGAPPGSPKQGDLWAGYTGDSLFIRNSGAWVFAARRTGGSTSLSSATNSTGGQNLYQGTASAGEYRDYISGALVPIAQNIKSTDTLSIPAGFGFTPVYSIIRNGPKKFTTTVDNPDIFRQRFAPKGKTYYLDAIAGSDTNDGLTRATAFKTTSKIITMTDMVMMRVVGSTFLNMGDITPTALDSISIIGIEGTPVMGSLMAELTWTSTSMTGVYKATVADSAGWPVNPLILGPMGEYVRFANTGRDTTKVGQRIGSYCYLNSTTIYVHTCDHMTPTKTNFLLVDDAIWNATGVAKLYIENVNFYGRTQFNSQEVYWQNVGIFYSPGVTVFDLITLTSTTGIFNNVRFGHANGDGLNYEAGCQFSELNCVGMYCGYNSSGADNQCSTAHDGADVVSVNCTYLYASNEAILDVNTGSTRLGCGLICGGKWEQYDDAAHNEYGIGAGNASGNYAQMWLVGVTIVGDLVYDYYVAYGKMYLQDVKIDATTTLNISGTGAVFSKF